MGHFMKRPISVLITEECNLRCEYCLTSSGKYQKEPLTIDFDFVKVGIKDYFDANPFRELRIYSVGEPTTNFDMVKKVVDFAQKISETKVHVELQSNGYFAHDIAKWISENIDTIWISLDGPPDIQDALRKNDKRQGSSRIIEKNIKYLVDKIEFGVRSTTTSISVDKQIELLDYCQSLGVKNVATKPVLSPVGTTKDKYSVDLMHYSRKFLDAWRYAQTIDLYYTCVLIFNFDYTTEYACRACFPTPHLTPDGFVSACDRAFLGATPLIELIYGQWNAEKGIIEYDYKKIKKIRQRTPAFMHVCNDCIAKDYCAGNCLGTGYQETGDLLGVSERYCEAIRFLFKEIKPEMNTCSYKGGHP